MQLLLGNEETCALLYNLKGGARDKPI